MNYLKQSTTTTIQLGPFLDDTDGKTAETGLTITSTDVYLSKNGAAFANPNDTNAATHDRAGWYRKQLNTTDTGTVGRLIVEVQESGALPVWREFMVVPANVYDSLIGGTDSLEVDVTAVSGDSTAADNLEADYDGAGYNKANSTIGTVTTNTDMVSEPPTAAAISDQVWDEQKAGHVAAGSFGEEVQAHALSTEISGLENLSAADVAAELETYDAPTKAEMDAQFAALNDPTETEIAIEVWDRVLTGGTHNIPSSAGRRLRNLQDFGVYEGGAIWIDTVNGTPGTTDYENGTVNNPVDSIADALTLAASVGLSGFMVLPGSSITLAASVDNYHFRGYEYTIALGGQSVSGTAFVNATITGNDDGSNAIATKYIGCTMGSNTLGKHTLDGCQLTGDIILAEAADYFWDQCFSGVAGTGTPSVDLESAAETKAISIRHYSGGIELKNFGAGGGTHTASIEGVGQVVLNANCAGGTIAIRGNFTLTDNAGGAVTLSDDARIDIDQVANQVWEEPIADHSSTVGSTAEALEDAGAAGTPPTVQEIRTEMDTNSTKLIDILADTAELITNQGNWLTATGFSTHSAADVQALLNDLSGPEMAAAIWNALIASYQDVGSTGEALADAGAAGTPPTVQEIRTEMDTNSTKLIDILADTAELITNQGNWLTATGFSTHSAADVQALLNDLSGAEIAAAVWDALIASYQDIGSTGEALADAGGAGTPPTVQEIRTEMDDNSTKLANIIGDTSELQGNQGNWLTATGFSTHSAADVQALLNDLSGAEIAAAVWDALIASYQVAGSTGEALGNANGTTPPTVEQIRTEMDDNSTKLAALLADTTELKADDVPGLIAALNDPTTAEIAQAVLSLGAAVVEDSADALSLTAVILAMFRGDIDEVGGKLVIRKSDRATLFSEENITVDAAAEPITSVGMT